MDQQTVDRAARAIYVIVAEYEHGNDAKSYDDLPEETRRDWERAAEHAIETTADRIIGAGRPVWWTTP